DRPGGASLHLGQDPLGARLEVLPGAPDAPFDVGPQTLRALHEQDERSLLAAREDLAGILAHAGEQPRPVLLQPREHLSQRPERSRSRCPSGATCRHAMPSSWVYSRRGRACPGPLGAAYLLPERTSFAQLRAAIIDGKPTVV